MGIGAANRMTCWCLILIPVDWISRREDAVVYRPGLSNESGSLALRLWYKSNNFAHIRSRHWLEKDSSVREQARHGMMSIIILILDVSPKFDVLQAVTKG
jgi:hypothetical protein